MCESVETGQRDLLQFPCHSGMHRNKPQAEPRVINSLVGGFSSLSKSSAIFGKLVAMCDADEGASLFPDD